MSILAIIDSIKANSSRLAKEDILRKNKDNTVLKRFFELALNPYIQFYQRKIPKYTPAQANQADSLDSVFDSLNALSTRQVTGNAAIDHLTKLLSSLTEDDAKVLEKVIQKDPDCGASDSTVNKIWPGLIPSYPVMLCSPFEKKHVDHMHWKRGVFVQLKSDGCRVNIIIDENSKVTVYSRNGRLFDIHGVFDRLCYIGKNVVIDGELLVKDDDGKILDRKTGNGICNKALKGTIKLEEAERLFINAWDLIPLEDFRKGICHEEYESRFLKLTGFVYEAQDYGHLNIGLIEHHTVKSFDEAQALYDKFLARGEEGAILKDKSVLWEDTRSKSCIKMKAERDADLLCVDVIPGTGKYEGKIGSLVCQSSDSLITVNVGSGLNDEDRSLDASKYVNRVIEVVYNEKIKSKDGTYSLFLPRFIAVREDKNTANSFKEIK